MPAKAPTADRVADAVTDLAVALSATHDPAPVRDGVRALVSGPLALFGSQHDWPSPFGDGGLPLEVSVKVAGGTRGVRCTVDPFDYRCSVAGNIAELAAAARGCVAWPSGQGNADDAAVNGPIGNDPSADGGWAQEPGRLVESLLAGAPEGLAAPVILSLGIGGTGLGRTTVYARTSFWPDGALGARLPGPAAALAGYTSTHGGAVLTEPVVFGVDYVGSSPTRWKSYHWLPARPGQFAAVVGLHPDLTPAAALYDRFSQGVREGWAQKAGFVQVTGGAGPTHQKVFFFAPAWGWSTPSGLADLLSFLPAVGARIDALPAVREVMARHEIPIRLSMVAIGGAEPTTTYYFLPRSA